MDKIHRNNSLEVWIFVSVIPILLTVCVCACSDKKEESVSGPASVITPIVMAAGSGAQSVYAAALNDALPTWDPETINTIPEEASDVDFLDQGEMVLLALVTNEELSLQGTSNNGNRVYSNQGETAALKVNNIKGYWKFVTPMPPIATNTLTDSDALALAEGLFGTFQLPAAERGGEVAVGVGASDVGPNGPSGPTYVEARHVRLYRELNGLRVWRSHLMATYALDGTLFRTEIRWPVFRLNEEAVLKTRAEAINEIAAALAQDYPDPQSVDELNASLVYWFDEDTGLFAPTLFVNAMLSGDSLPKTTRYSLTQGLWTPPAVAGDDV